MKSLYIKTVERIALITQFKKKFPLLQYQTYAVLNWITFSISDCTWQLETLYLQGIQEDSMMVIVFSSIQIIISNFYILIIQLEQMITFVMVSEFLNWPILCALNLLQ